MSVPPQSILDAVNARGTLGASILVDPVNGIYQAALIQGGLIKLIPPQPGEIFGFVAALNDNDTALILSSTNSDTTTWLYRDGKATPINFSSSIPNPVQFLVGINANGIIAGTEGQGFYNGDRGFRFDTRNSNAMILAPFPGDPTETLAWAQGINQAGNVLGYSFTAPGTPYHERIGIWGPNGVFQTYFVESIDTFHLLFNENNLIVITATGSNVSYLVPRPGVRFNLVDLVVNLPAGQDLASISGLNNRGDILGTSSTGANFFTATS